VRGFFARTRVRLTAAVGAVFFVIASAAAAAFWVTFAHIQYAAIDTSLASYTQTLLSNLQDSNGTISFSGGDPVIETQGVAVGVMVFDAQGRVLARTGIAMPVASAGAAARAAISADAVVADTAPTAAQPQRIAATPVQLSSTTREAVVVGRSVGDLQQTLFEVGALLAGVVAVLVVAVVALSYALAGRALRPVRLMAATARDISEHDLHRRVELRLPDDELGELAETLNNMLARLEVAFDSLQQFTADAAHELRAPLALLQAELEVSLRRARTPHEYAESERVALAEVERLRRLVNRLLILARSDAGALQPLIQRVDVGDLLEETAERWRHVAGARGVVIDVELVDEGSLNGDPELLRSLLHNLIDNAVRHTPSGGRVGIRAEMTDSTWHISVSDTGAGIPAGMRDAIFRRFTRGDAARAPETGGAGLGLALCRVIAEVHGGRIAVDDTDAGGAKFEVTLPSRQLTRAAQLEPGNEHRRMSTG
jgi:two-component system, OmpR family, sensor kinase